LAVAALEALGRPDCRLVMVGEDVDGRPISSAHVSALGKLPRAEVLDAYDACQVFILPSESESFSLVILEAWLRRKPVIGNAACGPVAALIEPGVDGYLCAGPQAMAQRIGELLDDPTRCAQMGMAGYQKVLARYTWERVSHNVLKVYQQVIDGTNRTARPLTT
jgi:glycosyltransferase involved in cell wall biosynthesis